MSGPIVLITGASRGIGRAILTRFAQAGATVIGTATSEQGANDIRAYLKDNGYQGDGKVLNVVDRQAIVALINEIASEFGDIGVLINNAGITQDNLLMRMKDAEWDSVIETNLSSIFFLSKAVSRGMMKARFGRIITLTSVVAAVGNAGQTNYAAAKAGIIGFSKSLARELGSRGITVNTVAPGFIATDMTDKLPEAQRTALIEQIPLAKLGQPSDIAEAVYFLSQAGYITGETLHVNGGMYMS